MNIEKENVGESRPRIFSALVMQDGKITRGMLEKRMVISAGTFTKEYKSYLEQYPLIKYNKQTREFTFNP